MQTALITTLLVVSSVSCVYAGDRDLIDGMADATCTLGLKVHQKLRNQPTVVHSPIGLHFSLSLALQGARGATETELLSLLNWGAGARTPTYLNRFYAEFLRRTSSKQKDGRLDLASAILTSQNISINPVFSNQAKDIYQALVINQDPRNPDSAETEINEFVANITGGIIQKIITRGSTSSKSSLILASALSFKGLWQLKFDPSKTQKQTFFRNDGTTTQVDMMKDTRVVLHKKDNQFGIDIVQIPFAGDKSALVIAVPQERNGLNQLEDLLTDTRRLESMLLGMSPKTVELSLPKFKIETKLDLKDTLRELGMVKASTPNVADFSGIVEQEGGIRSMGQRPLPASFQNLKGSGKEVQSPAGAGFPIPLSPDGRGSTNMRGLPISSTPSSQVVNNEAQGRPGRGVSMDVSPEDGRSSTNVGGSTIASTPSLQVVNKDVPGKSGSGESMDVSPEKLYISNVYHSTTIEINESGLMPDSSTDTVIQEPRNLTSSSNSNTASAQVRVVADRPFLFILRGLDSVTWVLMQGRFSAN